MSASAPPATPRRRNAGSPSVMRAATERQHQIRARRPARRSRKPLQPAQPDQGHAVGVHQPGRVVDRPQPLVPLALHHAVHAAHADVLAVPRGDPAARSLASLLRGRRAGPTPTPRTLTRVAASGEPCWAALASVTSTRQSRSALERRCGGPRLRASPPAAARSSGRCRPSPSSSVTAGSHPSTCTQPGVVAVAAADALRRREVVAASGSACRRSRRRCPPAR